ncbi:MAG: hypothetical protein ABIF77_00255, partial [bacterium]
MPTSQKVHIVNMAGAMAPYTRAMVESVKDNFVELGWDPDDVTITQPTGPQDYSLSPDDVFDQEGYGIVLFVGHGGHVEVDGEEQYIFETWRGGPPDLYEDVMTEEQWNEYRDWVMAGGLVHGSVTSKEDGNSYGMLCATEQFFGERLEIDQGAMVNFVGAFGWEMEQEALAAGAGFVGGWDGNNPFELGLLAFAEQIRQMVNADGDGPVDGLTAMNEVHAAGLGSYSGVFGDGALVTNAESAADFYLPAQLDFTAPFDCLEAGTHYYDVTVKYPDCPHLNQSFQYFPGGEFSLGGLPPMGAEIEFRARDAQGNTVAAGGHDLELTSGGNVVELCPCEGFFHAHLGAVNEPPGSGPGSQLIARIDYEDPTLAQGLFQGDWQTEFIGVLIPGDASVTYTMVGGGGEVLGYTVDDDVTIGCDFGSSNYCFGWVKLRSLETPEGTDVITVTGQSTGRTTNPAQVVLPPGGEAYLMPLWANNEVVITATAKDVSGLVLDVIEITEQIGCGETEVLLEFDTFGILLEATPEVAHGGWEFVTCTATVRQWMDYDINEPTGDPVSGLLVTFTSNLGGWEGDPFGYTDASGLVSAILVGPAEGGIAIVYARA